MICFCWQRLSRSSVWYRSQLPLTPYTRWTRNYCLYVHRMTQKLLSLYTQDDTEVVFSLVSESASSDTIYMMNQKILSLHTRMRQKYCPYMYTMTQKLLSLHTQDDTEILSLHVHDDTETTVSTYTGWHRSAVQFGIGVSFLWHYIHDEPENTVSTYTGWHRNGVSFLWHYIHDEPENTVSTYTGWHRNTVITCTRWHRNNVPVYTGCMLLINGDWAAEFASFHGISVFSRNVA